MDVNQSASENPLSRSFWCDAFDLRPLGLVRITLGLLIVVTILQLHPNLGAWYSDGGVLPRTLLSATVRAQRFCLLDAFGPRWLVEIYWLATLLAALSFLVGWRTRLAHVALFVLLTGFHERNIAVLDGSDQIERLMLFWLLFVPVGGRYSIDAIVRATRGERLLTHAPAFFIRLAQIQFSFAYLGNFINKMCGPMWRHGTALHYVFGMDHYVTKPLGRLLFHLDWFNVAGDYFTLALEGTFIILLFAPWLRGRLRALALIGGVALHVGIFATMQIGNFSFVMISVYPILILPAWIDRAQAWLASRSRSGATLLIADSSCRACRPFLSILSGCDLLGRLRLVESDDIGMPTFVEARRTPNELYAVSPKGELSRGWFAILAAGERAPLLWPLVRVLRFPLLRALCATWYEQRVIHSLSFAAPPARQEPAPSWWLLGPARLAMAVLLGLAFWSSLPHVWKAMPKPLVHLVQFCELWQGWAMFAPDPIHTDVWFKSEGVLADGRKVDAVRDIDGIFPPVELGDTYSRWTNYSLTLRTASKDVLLHFGSYVCQRWNLERPALRPALKEFSLWQETRPVPGPHDPAAGAWHEKLLWHHVCY